MSCFAAADVDGSLSLVHAFHSESTLLAASRMILAKCCEARSNAATDFHQSSDRA